MIFGSLLIALFFIFLLIRITTYFIGLGYIAAVVVDVIAIGGFVVFYGHHNWFIHIASGKAIYFWDVVLFVLIFLLYSSIVLIGTNKFPRIAGLFHYVIAWLVTGFIYLFINYAIFNQLGSLLINEQMNLIVHLIIISGLAVFIFKKRMLIFKQNLT